MISRVGLILFQTYSLRDCRNRTNHAPANKRIKGPLVGPFFVFEALAAQWGVEPHFHFNESCILPRHRRSRASSSYLIRTYLMTVGTGQITSPLPVLISKDSIRRSLLRLGSDRSTALNRMTSRHSASGADVARWSGPRAGASLCYRLMGLSNPGGFSVNAEQLI
jgi:hypothetical protein